MIPLPLMTFGTKAIIALVLILSYTGIVGWKGYTMGQKEWREEQSEARVLVMKQTVEVVKLDSATLNNALEQQRKQLERDRTHEIRWHTIKETDHIITAAECTISPDSLRLWNDENGGVSN